MKFNYMRRCALLLGAAALSVSAFADDAVWSDVTAQYLKNPSFVPAWQGALTGVSDGVGEIFDGAGEVYQVINDAKAGKYVLTANALYRYADNDSSKENMQDGANHNAYLYIGDQKVVVEGLFDNVADAPNDLAAVAGAFAAGSYAATVEIDHKGGDLRFGIVNYGGRANEWCAFSNFKLQGPDGEIDVPNGNFAEGFSLTKDSAVDGWDMMNSKGDVKTPDTNKGGGVFRKTNASPYNFEQELTLPAGTYRWGVQSFYRLPNGAGNVSGKYIHVKGTANHAWTEGETAWDIHQAGKEGDYDFPIVYVDDNIVNVACLYDVEMEKYPDNLWPVTDNGDGTFTFAESDYGYTSVDSGNENEAARYFINNPDKFRNYVEFTLTEEGSVYVGFGKASNDGQYWNPFRDFTLERLVSGSSAVEGIEADENAPVEYYNLQGVRVAEPANGIFIVKKGNKATKQIFK